MEVMSDISGESIEIKISHDGKTVWINKPSHCILRASNIPSLVLCDDRTPKNKKK